MGNFLDSLAPCFSQKRNIRKQPALDALGGSRVFTVQELQGTGSVCMESMLGQNVVMQLMGDFVDLLLDALEPRACLTASKGAVSLASRLDPTLPAVMHWWIKGLDASQRECFRATRVLHKAWDDVDHGPIASYERLFYEFAPN
ncbi:hypothetical protein NM208_g7330 [Fusarium decemcellulare]|uniref:Uncharacterized protein n=2 Tax=Fusarium decemcellulare TaxID=57161 RepID=A0ACC1S9L1_9HYPO|nr:hypothetical protein NM208_g7381 [Fusarium decemcellulare]KAJ3534956.1 hypothetical protein NM208_g7330 [Fusarium decemcellulare]